MAKAFEAVKVSERVYWVGAIDWTIRNFHGYLTDRGTTYNAYLIKGENTNILVDTVKRSFVGEMLERVSSVVDIGSVDTIISHHSELDHSGSLPMAVGAMSPKRVLTSKAGIDVLGRHFSLGVPVEAVVTDTPMDIDGVSMTFYDAKMLHWPESMLSFLGGDGVLFSQDGFGMHLASHERFTDELSEWVVNREASKYFANILMPLGGPVAKVLGKLAPLVPEVKVIANDHGPLWRTGIDNIVAKYKCWAERVPSRKMVVAYATMWQSTAQMARAIAEGAASCGVRVEVMSLECTHRSDVVAELLDAAAFVVGSPALNGQMYPTVADLLTYVKGLKPKGLIGAAFGSYGWSPSALEQVNGMLEEAKVRIVEKPLGLRFVPTDEDLLSCRQFGAALAGHIK